MKDQSKLAGLVPANRDWTLALLEWLRMPPLRAATSQWSVSAREHAERISKLRQ